MIFVQWFACNNWALQLSGLKVRTSYWCSMPWFSVFDVYCVYVSSKSERAGEKKTRKRWNQTELRECVFQGFLVGLNYMAYYCWFVLIRIWFNTVNSALTVLYLNRSELFVQTDFLSNFHCWTCTLGEFGKYGLSSMIGSTKREGCSGTRMNDLQHNRRPFSDSSTPGLIMIEW